MENPIFSSTDQAPHSCSNAHWYVGGLKLKINLNLWNTQSVPQPMFNTRMFKIQWVIARPKRTFFKKKYLSTFFLLMSPILKIYYNVAFNIFSQEMYFVGDEQCRLHILFYIIVQCSYFFVTKFIEFVYSLSQTCGDGWWWIKTMWQIKPFRFYPFVARACNRSIKKVQDLVLWQIALFHSSSHIRPLKIQFVRGKIGGDAKQFMKR